MKNNEDAYAYADQVSVNAAMRETSETHYCVRDRQNVPRGPPSSTSQWARGVTKGVTKAALINPYDMQLSPNKNPSNEAPKGTGTRLSKRDNPSPLEPIPVDAQPSWIQEMLDLEHVEMKKNRPSIMGQSTDKPGLENTTKWKHRPQQQYNVKELMKTMLSTPVTIPIGELWPIVQNSENN